MLGNFVHVTLQPNKGGAKQTMVIAIQRPDRCRPVLSLQAVSTAVKWRLTCSASEQHTLLWALVLLSAAYAGITTFLLEIIERGSVHRRQFFSAHKSLVTSVDRKHTLSSLAGGLTCF